MSEQRKIAVTGANGFIGGHCVVALLEAGFDVVAVVRDPTNPSKTKFIEEEASKIGKRDNLSFGSGDLLKEGSYDDAFDDTWGVLHTAAAVIVKDIDDPYESIVKPAIAGTKNVTTSVKKHSRTIQRFVNVSSVAAIMNYDKPADTVFTEDDWNTWATVEKGASYAYGKTEAEKAISNDEDLKSSIETIVSINPSIVIGPCFIKSHTVSSSPSTIAAVLAGKPLLPLLGSFPYVDIRDVAKGAVLAFTQDKEAVAGRRFILSATEPIAIEDLNKIVQKSHPEAKGSTIKPNPFVMGAMVWLGANIPFLRKPMGYTEQWNFWDFPLLFDNTRSKTILGIGEYRSFEETCKDTADSIQALLVDDDDEK